MSSKGKQSAPANNNKANKQSAPATTASATTKKPSASAAATPTPPTPSSANTTTASNITGKQQQQQQQQQFQLPKTNPISIYKNETLSDREKFLLMKMQNMKLYQPKELPPPRLNRNRGWLHVILEKYNIETALYMIEPWERWILNTLLVLFISLIFYWMWWSTRASIGYWREYGVPLVEFIRKEVL